LPFDDFPFTIHRLYQRRARLDPVAAVEIVDVADLSHFGFVNVATNDAVEPFVVCVFGQHFFEIGDEGDRFFDIVLDIFRKRPVAVETDATARTVEQMVQVQQQIVADIAQFGDPAFGHRHRIEIVPVGDIVAASIEPLVHRLVADMDTVSQQHRHEWTQKFVVIAGDIKDIHPFSSEPQNFLNDIRMRLFPDHTTLDRPSVNDVADEIDRFGLVLFEKIEKRFSLAKTGAKMDVRYEYGAIFHAVIVVKDGYRSVTNLSPFCNPTIVSCGMKIALFTDTFYDPNGVSRFLQDMAKQAGKTGKMELEIFTSTRKKPHLPAPRNVSNVPPRWAFPMPFYPQLDLAIPRREPMIRHFETFSPDIVHVSTPGPVGLIGRKAAMRHGIPLVGTYHTDFPQYIYDNTGIGALRYATKQVMRHFYRSFSHILTRSSLYRDILLGLGLHDIPITVLQAGTDTKTFNPSFKQKFSWRDFEIPDVGFKLLYVGRLTKEKRFLELIELWKRFKSVIRQPAQLIVAGEGEYAKRVEEMKGLSVYYLGHMEGDRLSYLYAASDLFISLSITETLGQSILEAMASGTPVVTANIGGHLSFVDDSCGAVVPYDDEEAWLLALLALFNDPAKREKAASAALKKGESMTIEASFNHFVNVHETLVESYGSIGHLE
jgi:glycosyltransferase involved in cell wall biosynthesis